MSAIGGGEGYERALSCRGERHRPLSADYEGPTSQRNDLRVCTDVGGKDERRLQGQRPLEGPELQ